MTQEPLLAPDVEPRPDAAAALFGARLPLADRFVEHLATTAVERGLVGPREVPRLWSRHVLNCAVLQELIGADQRVVDVGSGAGLPGVTLAVARPDLRLVLVEPLERRVAWLQMVVDDLGLDVEVRRARAEEVVGTVRAPVVTARAVAPLERLAAWGLPLLEAGGTLLAIKGRSAAAELEAASAALARLGAVEQGIVECGSGLLEVPTTVVSVRVGDRVPRGPDRRDGGSRRRRRKGQR